MGRGGGRVKAIECEPLKLSAGCRKKRHATRDEADLARQKTHNKNRRRRSRRGRLNVYFCTSCDGWHVGHYRPWETSTGRPKR
jgi:hypothetical protein